MQISQLIIERIQQIVNDVKNAQIIALNVANGDVKNVSAIHLFLKISHSNIAMQIVDLIIANQDGMKMKTLNANNALIIVLNVMNLDTIAIMVLVLHLAEYQD